MTFTEWLQKFRSSGKNEISGRPILSTVSDSGYGQIVSVGCRCGNVKEMPLYSLAKGVAGKTCGECGLHDLRRSGRTEFGQLQIITDLAFVKSFSDNVDVKCSCGNVVKARLRQVVKGKRKTCFNCVLFKSKRDAPEKFGELTVITDLSSVTKILQKVDVLCSCGNRVQAIWRNLITGNTKTCGKCEFFRFRNSGIVEFGSLTITDPDSVTTLSDRALFSCKCGNSVTKKVINVVSGHTKTCGKCRFNIRSRMDGNGIRGFRKSDYPIPPGVLFGTIAVKNEIRSAKTKLDAVCPACGSEWHPTMQDILRSYSVTCGCSYNKISTQQVEIFEFLREAGLSPELEFKVGRYSFDIYVPGRLLIEYNGLKWHSMPDSRSREMEKSRAAADLGIPLVSIYEDEWRDRRGPMESILKSRLGIRRPNLKLRPSDCHVSRCSARECEKLLSEHHYLGGCRSGFGYAAYYAGEMVACAIFKSPTRQSVHQRELVRMVSHPKFSVHGIWSKFMNAFVRDEPSSSVVSFSDNRLFTGDVYGRMGFKLDGEVRPDYYWTKARKRFHKSGLRKPKGEVRTESELRRLDGYRKVWDLGKKRWVFDSHI